MLECLTHFGSALSQVTKEILYATLILPDDGRVVTSAQYGIPCFLRPLLNVPQYGGLVKHLHIIEPAYQKDSVPGENHTLPARLSDEELVLLLRKCGKGLKSVTWSSLRPPGPDFVQKLNQGGTMVDFSVDLTNTSSLLCTSNHRVGPTECIHEEFFKKVKWNGQCLTSLPLSLRSLVLGQLSHIGIKELAKCITLLENLENLEIFQTAFIDDMTLGKVAQSCQKLSKLALKNITGTKVTDKGLGDVLKMNDLRDLELIRFQGLVPLYSFKAFSSHALL